MKKRIGSRIYDTNTAERICSIEGGSLYQKRTRNREWFAVYDDGTIRPLDPYDPSDQYLMETGKPAALQPEPAEYRIKLDADTWHTIKDTALRTNTTMAEVVRRAFQ